MGKFSELMFYKCYRASPLLPPPCEPLLLAPWRPSSLHLLTAPVEGDPISSANLGVSPSLRVPHPLLLLCIRRAPRERSLYKNGFLPLPFPSLEFPRQPLAGAQHSDWGHWQVSLMSFPLLQWVAV